MKSTKTIFFTACGKGCLELVKLCIKDGVDIHDGYNWALRLSIANNQYEVIKFLLENGADPYDRASFFDKNAFGYTKYWNKPKILTLLEQYEGRYKFNLKSHILCVTFIISIYLILLHLF